jgi:hypothetical protein
MTQNITQIPAPRVPFIDERTGQIAREWFRFLNNQYVLTGGGTTATSIADLEITPSLAANTEDELAVVKSELQALNIAPPVAQEVFADYAMVYDTTNHVAAATNTPYAVTFNTTAYARGIRIGSPTSRILCNRPGIYNFMFSAQIDKTSGGTGNIWLWGRKNGTDIPQSASRVQIQGNNAELVATVNFYVEMSNGDYFELMYAVSDTSVIILAEAPTAFAPAVPSIILTVNQVNL